MNHCVDTIFPNNVLPKENRRLKNDSDKTWLEIINSDFFNEAIPIKDTVRKYFQSVKKVKQKPT
jgi:hypothetical protein